MEIGGDVGALSHWWDTWPWNRLGLLGSTGRTAERVLSMSAAITEPSGPFLHDTRLGDSDHRALEAGSVAARARAPHTLALPAGLGFLLQVLSPGPSYNWVPHETCTEERRRLRASGLLDQVF